MNKEKSLKDWRNIKEGFIIHDYHKSGYCDAPYIVINKNGNWVCVMTVNSCPEGSSGQHIISKTSFDKGKTWSEPIEIEPEDGPVASQASTIITPNGRIYVFYNYNKENIRDVIIEEDGFIVNWLDHIGYSVFKYSDDGGKTWSKERYNVPKRLMKIDLENPYKGKKQLFHQPCKPLIFNNIFYLPITIIGGFGRGDGIKSEGIIITSDNILFEKDPNKIRFETLPDGEIGIRTPDSPIGDEFNLTFLDDGSLYGTFRTEKGYICNTYSRDGGHTWIKPQYATYKSSGKKIKNPRAANFVRRHSNGYYTLWFHNNGKDFTNLPFLAAYKNRNPAWISGGIEKDGYIYWSQPEVFLYDDDSEAGMGINRGMGISYPDFVEENNNFFISETQKTIARVHKIDNEFLNGLWNQFYNKKITKKGIIIEVKEDDLKPGTMLKFPELPNLKDGNGFSLEFWIKFLKMENGQIIFDSRDNEGKGIVISITDKKTIKISLNDGKAESAWACDENILKKDFWHHITIIIDGGPKIILFSVDGVICDGGENRQFGWGRFNKNLDNISGSSGIEIPSNSKLQLKSLRIYNRSIRVSEAVGNYKAGF